MIVVMFVTATEGEIQQVVSAIEAQSMRTLIMPGGDRVAIGIPSAIPPERRDLLAQPWARCPVWTMWRTSAVPTNWPRVSFTRPTQLLRSKG